MVIFSKNNAGKFDEKNEVKFGKDEKIDGKLKQGQDPEQELENLIIDNPNIVPISEFSSESSSFIPLAKQIDLSHHGRLDIIGVDNMGNLYIIECKITTINADKKSIRGQITDYVAGLWSKRKDWDFFNKSIKKTNTSESSDIQQRSFANLSLEEIIQKKLPDEYENVLKNIKNNFEKGKYFLIFAVDKITIGMRETIDYHNQALDRNDSYPLFGLEIKKYSGDNNDDFIATQIYPFDSDELRRKIDVSSSRYANTQQKWDEQFNSTNLSDSHREQILQFKIKLEKLVNDDGGKFVYGSGVNAGMMPRFNSSSTRSAIGLYATGDLKMNLELLKEDYRHLYDELRIKFVELDYIKKRYKAPDGNIEFWVNPEEWLPYRDKIVSILEDVLVK